MLLGDKGLCQGVLAPASALCLKRYPSRCHADEKGLHGGRGVARARLPRQDGRSVLLPGVKGVRWAGPGAKGVGWAGGLLSTLLTEAAAAQGRQCSGKGVVDNVPASRPVSVFHHSGWSCTMVSFPFHFHVCLILSFCPPYLLRASPTSAHLKFSPCLPHFLPCRPAHALCRCARCEPLATRSSPSCASGEACCKVQVLSHLLVHSTYTAVC